MEAPEPFSVGRSVVLKQLFLLPSVSWPVWVGVVIGLVLTAVGCFFDVRFVVLGLMICVAVLPVVLVFIYLIHTLSPAVVPNLLPHTLERYPDGYLLRVWRRHDPEDNPECELRWTESEIIRLCDSNIVTTKTSFEYDILFFKDSQMNILYVPRHRNENTKEYKP